MKIFFSKKENAGHISESCYTSMNNWIINDKEYVIYRDKDRVVYDDSSYHYEKYKSRGGTIYDRYGFILLSKNAEFSIHFTASRLGWGVFKDKSIGSGNIIVIPDGLDNPNRSVYGKAVNNGYWVEFTHPEIVWALRWVYIPSDFDGYGLFTHKI